MKRIMMKSIFPFLLCLAIIASGFVVHDDTKANSVDKTVIDNFLNGKGVPEDTLNKMSSNEKETMYFSLQNINGETEFISYKESDRFANLDESDLINDAAIDVFLNDKGVPDDILNKMSSNEKETMYLTLKDIKDDVKFVSFNECTINSSGNMIEIEKDTNGNRITPFSISDEYLKFSATSFYVPQWYCHVIYPHYEWITFMPDIGKGSFAFALKSNEWRILTTPYLRTENRLGQTTTNNRPDKMDYAGAGFRLNASDVIGTACIDARYTSSNYITDILIKYAHDKSIGISSYNISIGPFSISFDPNSPLTNVDTTEVLIRF